VCPELCVMRCDLFQATVMLTTAVTRSQLTVPCCPASIGATLATWSLIPTPRCASMSLRHPRALVSPHQHLHLPLLVHLHLHLQLLQQQHLPQHLLQHLQLHLQLHRQLHRQLHLRRRQRRRQRQQRRHHHPTPAPTMEKTYLTLETATGTTGAGLRGTGSR